MGLFNLPEQELARLASEISQVAQDLVNLTTNVNTQLADLSAQLQTQAGTLTQLTNTLALHAAELVDLDERVVDLDNRVTALEPTPPPVNNPPTIDPIADQTLEVDQEVAVVYVVADPDANDTLEVTAVSDNPAVVTATLSLNEVLLAGVAAGSATVTVTVRDFSGDTGDPHGTSDSTSFVVTVEEAPVQQPPPTGLGSVWISPTELAALPMSGPEWDSLIGIANNAPDTAVIIADQDGSQDVKLMAVALAAARTGSQTLRDKALSIFNQTVAIDWRADTRMNMLEWGRNFLALYIAADVLDIRSGPIYDFLLDALDGCEDQHNNNQVMSAEAMAWKSGSNANSQIAAGAIAGAIYTGDQALLDRLYVRFQRFAGDRNSTFVMDAPNEWNSFEVDPTNPVGIQNAGATKDGCNVDGAVGNDVGRSNGTPCNPTFTMYGSTGCEGWSAAAFMLHRQGYPALTEQNSAIKRAYLYWRTAQQLTGDASWDDPSRAPVYRHLLKVMYPELDIVIDYPTGIARTVCCTGWTHPVA